MLPAFIVVFPPPIALLLVGAVFLSGFMSLRYLFPGNKP
jgi:hypothetical protein